MKGEVDLNYPSEPTNLEPEKNEAVVREVPVPPSADPPIRSCCTVLLPRCCLWTHYIVPQFYGASVCPGGPYPLLPPEVEEVVPLGQRRAWCWCMCFGLAFMLAGIVLGGAYLYRYFVSQRGVYFCGIRYTEDDMALAEPYAESRVRYHSFKERIQILEEEEVELINVPVPEFADSDPADIVHDFHRKLTAYLDLSLNKCYVIPLNTSVVMPPRNFLELLINIKAGTYLPQSYLIHEQMVVTDRIENVDQLGVFIRRLCQDKETYKLQRRNTIRGKQKRGAERCSKIIHFENKFAVETSICHL